MRSFRTFGGKAQRPETGDGTSIRTMRKLLKIIGRYRVLLICTVLLAALSVALQLYIPNLFGDAVDSIVGESRVDFAALAGLFLKIACLIAAASVTVWVMNVLNNRLAYKTVQVLRARAIRQIQHLPLSYLDSHSTGDILQRIIADTDQLSDGLLLGFQQLFAGVMTIALTLYFMFRRNIGITLMVVALTPVSFLVARFIASRSFRMFRRQTEARGRETALLNEMIGGIRVVKAFGHEQESSAEFFEINEELRESSEQAVFFSSLTNPSTRAVNNVIYALVALIGAFRILDGVLTVGGLTVLLSYANQYMKPFNDISSVITELQNAMACAARIFDLIEAEPESPDAEISEKAEKENIRDGEVEICGVSFSYDPCRKLIENFNFRAEPGTMTAIVGPTGCGKTTLINLLMRFYDVDGGRILVDGRDIREMPRHELRKGYGMVLQETWIRSGTVRENIVFGKPDATDEEVIAAAKASHSWEFIRRLPQKLDTVISEDELSQGQKQLLCITRVMLVSPPMLILDEATSSIDTRTELQVQEAFARLMQGRTSFIVAHRLSTIRGADRILVMKDGTVIEQGTHDSLLEQGGFYRTLYDSQFAGAQTESEM